MLIALPELADYTDRWRKTSYDERMPGVPIADLVPPHITVLVPWADPADDAALDRLAKAVQGFGVLELTFAQADAFGNGSVVFLQPEPADVLTGLLRTVAAAFPEHPPYGGSHPDPHPHVTVAMDGDAQVLASARSALAVGSPPAVRVDSLGVYAPSADGVWRERSTVTL